MYSKEIAVWSKRENVAVTGKVRSKKAVAMLKTKASNHPGLSFRYEAMANRASYKFVEKKAPKPKQLHFAKSTDLV